MKSVPVVYTLDNNVVEMTYVSALSVIKNSKFAGEIFFFVKDLSAKSYELLNSLKKASDVVAVNIVDITKTCIYDRLKTACFGECGIMANARLFLGELLAEYDKVLYLDGDTFVRGDINVFLSKELGENYVYAVKEIDFFNTGGAVNFVSNNELSPENIMAYFNSGVLLLNLKKIREHGIERESFDVLCGVSRKLKLKYVDQDVLNFVLLGGVKFCEFNYNYPSYLHASSDVYSRVKIVHFMANCKPWSDRSRKIFRDEYMQFVKQETNLSYFFTKQRIKFPMQNLYKNLLRIKLGKVIERMFFMITGNTFENVGMKIKR